ncbi:efflux RND transporter permease subunit [Pelobacter sp. M08fum]|uniref:Efflux RND transporter permease subunit n=1 Tax=Pelovirga terrestris TaxID=2771352 RepID=A0A8J6QML5_9BACT|nr:efflux RND transporter permease subunit [Pelovirga terrestris]
MIAWFARNHVAANLLMALIIGLGLWAVTDRIPMEVFPEFERDTVIISAVYRGATPAEVEEAVIIRIEEAIAAISGIDTIISTANEGSGQVRVDVLKGYKPREIMDDIRNKVDAISTFPEEVERPTYSILEFRREVISVVIGANLPEADLRKIGEMVRDDLTALPAISLADLVAVRPYELSVEVNQPTLEQYQLSLEDLSQAIRRHSLDLPAGAIKTRGGEILLRTMGQAASATDYARIPVRTTPAGSQLLLGDIATIHDGFDEDPLEAVLNGKSAVMIEVYRTGEQNALDVGRAVREYVAEKREILPPGVSIDYWRDRSRIVQLRLNTLTSSALQGGILIFLALALFLRFSVAIWVCIGIPISFLGALALMPTLGVTLNSMSLFAFILVLGIVVDDAIITGENVYRRLKEDGESIEGIIAGTQEVAVPVTFGLLTTIVAFTPLLFMEGVRGPIFAQIPLIVIPALAFSWVESKLILPAHLSSVHITKPPRGALLILQKLQQKIARGLELFALRIYQPVLELAVRRRHLTLSIFTAAIIIIVSFVVSGRYGYTFFPRIQSEIARATLIMPAGTSIDQTRTHIERMAQHAYALQAKHLEPDGKSSVIRNILVSTGWTGTGSPGMGGKSELGQVTMEMVPPEERLNQISTSEVVQEWRQLIGTVPGARELTYRAEIGRGGNPVDVQLTGADFNQLSEVTELLKQRYSEYPGLFDIQDSFDQGKQEIQLRLLPEAKLLGLTTTDLGRQVRAAFFGSEAQRIQRGRDDVRVMVRYPKEQRQNLASLETMKIRTQSGVEVPFNQVAAIDMQAGYSSIRRVDRNRAVNVSADAEKGEVDTNAIAADLRIYLDELLLEYPGIRYTFKGELEEQRESMGSLIYGVIFVLFAIYALLAIPFRSYLQPLPVMLVIPFSIGGAIVGHMIMGFNLSFMSLLGILALCGVVVNNSLVLVDFINRRRREGMPMFEAVMLSGVNRFRPILLTSLTTFLGLTPLLFDTSTQAQFLIPMAVSLGFGILFSTFLSLLLVPATYLILEDIIGFFRAEKRV